MKNSNNRHEAITFNTRGFKWLYLSEKLPPPSQAFIGRKNKNEISVKPTVFSSCIIYTNCFVLNKQKKKE